MYDTTLSGGFLFVSQDSFRISRDPNRIVAEEMSLEDIISLDCSPAHNPAQMEKIRYGRSSSQSVPSSAAVFFSMAFSVTLKSSTKPSVWGCYDVFLIGRNLYTLERSCEVKFVP